MLLIMGGGGVSQNWARMHLLADAVDAHRLDRTGDKWFPAGKAADKAIEKLCGKIAELDPPHSWAMAVAIQFFWQHTEPEEIDHQVDEWWGLPFRRKLLREGGEHPL